MTSYNKCIYISVAFLVVGFGMLLFSTLLMKGLITDSATTSAQLKEETNDLWAFLPGKSKVQIYKEHYFYNVENLEDIFYSNQKPKVTEKGPYSVREYDEFLNRTYSDDNSTVYFNFWRYHNISAEDQEKEEDLITTINLPSLGFWYQAKNSSPSQVALKALYTIYQSLIYDFYYGAIQQAVQIKYKNSTDFLDRFESLSYFDDKFKNAFSYDNDYGIYGNNNAFFVKAVLTHPSTDSKFLMDYWGFAEVEMGYFKKTFVKAKELAFNMNTQVDLAVKQWLDLSINKGESIASSNSTAPGYVEYGAFLKNVLATGKSSLSYDQARTLFFEFNDVGRNPRIDDSSSLINKVNLEKIFGSPNEESAIKFIDNQMKINNLTESGLIYKYLLYASGELAFRYSAGGTKGIGALSDILSQALYQVFNTMGDDMFYGVLSNQLFVEYFSTKSCNDALNAIKLPSKFNVDLICAYESLITTKFDNMKLWINGIFYKDAEFIKVLNDTQEGKLDEYDILQLTQRNSTMVQFFEIYANKTFIEYNITGNYMAKNLMNLASYQWAYSNITKSVENINPADSIIGWNPSHYKKAPEYSEFCRLFGYENNIDFQSIKAIANFDNMFSSKWVADAFINYYKNDTSSPFYSKQFINYLRYVFLNEVLNIFTTKSVKELLWGYEDELLKIAKETNYFLGGDPTISTTFSLLNNNPSPPVDNIWSMNTGVVDSTKTREYKTMSGSKDSSIIIREPYFDGENTTWIYRNPWNETVNVTGTDAISFSPNVDKSKIITAYLDDLYRSVSFTYNSTKTYLKLKADRYILEKKNIYNSTLNTDNKKFFSDVYNGMGNFTSVFKAPLFASKPSYYECDNLHNAKPDITPVESNAGQSNDQDDVDLFYESWVDVEPYSGAVLRAAQKLMISALLEKDELFENENRFVPVYYVFRTGNFSESGVLDVFDDLIVAISFKLAFVSLSVAFISFAVALFVFACIKKKQYIEASQLNSPLLSESE